jgi:prolyl oligopeptidase
MRIPAISRALRGGTALALGLVAAALANAQGQPVAPVRPVTTDYFGTQVVDNYRYMEDLGNAEVRAWMKAQADYTRAKLDAIPGRAALKERIHALLNADLRRSGFVRRGNRYFYEVTEPSAQLPKLYYRDGLAGEEHLLVDPALLAKGTSTHYALDFYEPSNDGKLLAYGVSAGGSEKSVLYVMDVATGKLHGEAIARTSDNVIGWRPDNRSFFYLRYNKVGPDTPPAESEYNARTYLHHVDMHVDGEGDVVVFGRGVKPGLDVPEGQGTYILLSPDSPYAVAVSNHNMDDAPATVYVAPLAQVSDSRAPWKKVADVSDGATQFALHGQTLFVLSQKNAARFRLLATPLAHPDLAHAAVVIPESHAVLSSFALAKDGIYARERDGAVTRVRQVSFDGKRSHVVPTPFEGNALAATTDIEAPGALIGVKGWLRTTEYVFHDPATGRSAATNLTPAASIDTSGMEAEEVFATSYDGTRIPLSLIHRKGLALDGSHPTILAGYGAYGIVLEPGFSPTRMAWLERGGIYAVAHIRGGGEYGDDWHLAGQKKTKLNTVFDFIACGQYLVDQHYTTPARLAGNGGSAGGITVGGALTWRPDLFGVILDQVGMSDTLRFETEPNGPPNVPETGSTRDEAGFHGLYAMSAYAHVRDGVAYPATLFSTGANDPRVSPWQMDKMAARVQAATAGKAPILLRVDYDAGHGIGSSNAQYEQELADMWSFALWQMGDPAFQPAAKP